MSDLLEQAKALVRLGDAVYKAEGTADYFAALDALADKAKFRAPDIACDYIEKCQQLKEAVEVLRDIADATGTDFLTWDAEQKARGNHLGEWDFLSGKAREFLNRSLWRG